MNDPHVHTLKYRIQTSKSVSYKPEAKLEFETDDFKGHLQNGTLSIEMKTHFASEEDALKVVGPVLRAWEVHTGLTRGPSEIRFEYDGAHVIDRKPDQSKGVVTAAITMTMKVSDSVEAHVVRSSYPKPPTDFKATDLAQAMWGRYESHLRGQEALTAMAYFCLTAIQHDTGTRATAATKYAIDKGVLDKLGELTSVAGDESSARKYPKGGGFRPYTRLESQWMLATVKRLILRVGELAAANGHPIPQITMNDLPKV